MKKWIVIGLSVLVVLFAVFMATNKVAPVGWGLWGERNASSGLALEGYDPVAYFSQAEAVAGSDDFTHDWGGVSWRFASAANRDRFAADPAAYAPQFGGYCAFAVSKGLTADISPDAWHIEDGKLYVFADQEVRDSWVEGLSEGSLKQADANWANR